MSSITIRDLDPALKTRLRVRAARAGRSMEEEVRVILRAALAERGSERGFGSAVHELFAVVGGVELTLPRREPAREPPGIK
jgi:plasmid stability protein